MTDLLLMTCRSPYLDSEKVYPPLGLLYLKSYINQQMPEVNIDITDDYSLEDSTRFEGYNYIGLSVMTPQREESQRVLEKIKSVNPSCKVIIGGPHANHYHKEVVQKPWDYIVPNDGQRSLEKILKGEGKRVERDIMTKDEWRSMPRPDRTSDKAKNFLRSYCYTLNGKPAGTMLTATGCPERCTFCEDAMTAVRWGDISSLAKEMDDLVSLGYKGVYLFDDLFAIAMPTIKPILSELKKRELQFRCNGQARYFTKWGEEFARLLGENGCVEIAFGHETGSQKILDNINKRTTVKQNYDSIAYAKKHGIYVKSFLMLGLPGEDYDTIAETEKFIVNAGMDDFQLAIYYPYKGTQIRDAIDKGDTSTDLLVSGEGLGAYGQKGGATESVVSTSALSSQDLLEFRDYLVNKYKPKSHNHMWDDKFFDSHLARGG